MKIKIFSVFFMIVSLFASLIMVPVSAENLLKTDFQKESFAKTIDYFDYARAWALLNGLPEPPDAWHANVYVAYVNKTGLQMVYTGLCNISLADQAFLTIPMQSILLHYKTEQSKNDALVASSFLMIMGFNDTVDSVYNNSPDRNDTLWASFSFGLNLNQMFPNLQLPSFNSKSEIYPLTPSNDGLTWKWGMKYTNLTALWITTHITEGNETDTSRPWGLATYDELTFNYTLNIDPKNHKATISQDFAIGRMRDLWIFGGWFMVWPIYNHYNSTGCYMYRNKLSNETIYTFLEKNNIKMSIVEYQTSVIEDGNTHSTSSTGQNIGNSEVFVGNSTISTYADGGEKIADVAFGVKETYNLFNYTEDPEETTFQTYEAIARTANISDYARNQELLKYQGNFSKYLPLILVHMYPELFERAKEIVSNMTRADYLFLISYPHYSGYKIEHDPVYTVYYAPTTSPASNPNLRGYLVLSSIAALVVVALIILKRHFRMATG